MISGSSRAVGSSVVDPAPRLRGPELHTPKGNYDKL